MRTFDAFQPLVWSPQFKQNCFPHRSKMGVLKSFLEEAEAIIRNAHAFVEQFRDKEREELISILVLEKYFRHTKQ